MRDVDVRRATLVDAERVFQLIRALADYEKLTPPDDAALARLREDIWGPRPRLDAFLAWSGVQAVGYALVLETYSSFLALPTLYLEDLFVLPQWRGRRAGKALFQAMIAEADRRGCGRMEWTVLDWNTPAQDFYKRFGAQIQADWQYWRLKREEFEKALAQ